MRKTIITSMLIIITLLMGLVIIKTNDNIKIEFKDSINTIFPSVFKYQYYYQNNEKIYNPSLIDLENNNVKEIQVGNNKKYMINHSRGFAMNFPRDVEFDFSMDQEYIYARSNDMSIMVTKEFSPYEGTRQYIQEFLNKYLLNDRFQTQNKIVINKNAVEKIGDHWIQIVSATRTPYPESEITQNTYVYCYIYTYSQHFFRIMFKSNEYNDELMKQVYSVLYSFKSDIPIVGTASTYTDYKPIPNKNWSQETKDLYDNLRDLKTPKWAMSLS